jgi:hypothetical protein
MSINNNTIFHLKSKIKADLEIMKNCLQVEHKRLNILKNLVVQAEQYEYCASLRDIEKKLIDTLNEIENLVARGQ